MSSQPSSSRSSQRVPFERVMQLVLADNEENGAHYAADSDSGEEFNGSVDSHSMSDAESGSDTDTDTDTATDRGNRSRAKRRRVTPAARRGTTGMSIFSVLCLVIHTQV